MSLQDIYQEVLLEHNDNPHNFCVLEHPSHQAYGNNPLCGDELTIHVQIEANVIRALSFTGEGCAICKASASLMTLTLEGKTITEATQMCRAFIALLNDDTLPIPSDLGEREALLGVRKFPARLKCATLAWHTFLKALSNPDGKCFCKSKGCCGHCCG